MLSRFFIARPIFAWVIALAVMFAGAAAIFSLPIAQYPDVAPPSVSIRATYTGASSETVESSVTQVIEQQLTGLDGLLYFSSSSSSAGSASITATFEKGTNPDTAQVQVQNKVQQAMTRLPTTVQQQGVTVTKSQTDFLLIVALFDKTNKVSDTDIADYLVSKFQDDLARVKGVGQVQVFGSEYAMRVWLDPYKLAAVQLMPSDVSTAIEAQNIQVSAGQIGARPAVAGQRLNATVTAKARLQTPEQFRDIIVKTQTNGATVRLSDVARVEMGAEDYSSSARWNGHPASGVAIQLAPGADALSTAKAVKARVAELAVGMPDGYTIGYARDTTDFIKLSVEEVVQTLFEAVLLVVIVMFVFLQNWRATLIPAIAVPVVLLGTFGVLSVFGYSINTLTLFGMVLAIGLLVDDAIVVVENVQRIMDEEGLAPREATLKSMEEISGALIGIALVLSAVLLPMAFFGGSTGVIYKQFSVTIVSAMLLSVLVALILTPALCATLLKPRAKAQDRQKGWAGGFNTRFDRLTRTYVRGVGGVVQRRILHLGVYAIILILLGVLFVRLPSGFLPTEDQGQAIIQYTLPAGATAERTQVVGDRITRYFLNKEKTNIASLFSIGGFSFAGSGENAGLAFSTLAPWGDRKGAANSSAAITQRATQNLSDIRDAQVFALTPPSISGLGQSNGFTFQLLNNSGMSRDQFLALRDKIIGAANQDPHLSAVRAATLDDAPQVHVNIDDAKLAALGLTESDVTNTLSAAWGGAYVNDFIDRGRVKKVYMQGDQQYRSTPSDLDNWFVRGSATTAASSGNASSIGTSSTGATTNAGATTSLMSPFSAFSTTAWEKGPTAVSRFNGLSSYAIQGEAASGSSSGDAMKRMMALQKSLAPGTGYAWSDLSYQENQSSGRAAELYSISILAVFLCLAALYESWSIPLAVLLVLPLGLVGAVLAVTLRGLENDIYFQVGLLTTIGLSAKNAILIVEFAEAAHRRGAEALTAALDAARIRLRPILMTSLAFIAGVFPLAISTGPGAQSRIEIGTAVIGGMLTATLIAIFYVPMFFVVVAKLFGGERRRAGKEA